MVIHHKYQDDPNYPLTLKKLHRIVPEFSVIGRLFESDVHPMIVASSASEFTQHAPLTWITDGYEFVRKDQYDDRSRKWTYILNEWAVKTDDEERKIFIQQFFEAMHAKGILYFDQFLHAKGHEKKEIQKAIKHTDWPTRKQFLYLLILIIESMMPESAELVRNGIQTFQKYLSFMDGLLEYYKQK